MMPLGPALAVALVPKLNKNESDPLAQPVFDVAVKVRITLPAVISAVIG